MPRPRAIVPALVVFVVASLASLHAWIQPVEWSDPDGLYYQAKTLGFRGQNERAALHRAFHSPIADEVLAGEREALRADPREERQFTNPRWIDYTSRFFERRLLVRGGIDLHPRASGSPRQLRADDRQLGIAAGDVRPVGGRSRL
jgi:hypothetical protein